MDLLDAHASQFVKDKLGFPHTSGVFFYGLRFCGSKSSKDKEKRKREHTN
jgi:hypothetical protein